MNLTRVTGVASLAVGVALINGCVSAPVRPASPSAVFARSAPTVRQAALDALSVTGFDVEQSDTVYLQGYRPRKLGLVMGSGGETVRIWIDALEPSKTAVRVVTSRTSFGYGGQQDWDGAIVAEMEKLLGPRIW